MIQIRFDGRRLDTFLSARPTGLPCEPMLDTDALTVATLVWSVDARVVSGGIVFGGESTSFPSVPNAENVGCASFGAS